MKADTRFFSYLYLMLLLIASMELYAQKVTEQFSGTLIGHWNFNNQIDLLHAEIGEDLVLYGKHKVVAGPNDENGAVRIGNGSYYLLRHGLNIDSSIGRVNEFSLIFDLKINEKNNSYPLIQTDLTNKNNAEVSINSSGNICVDGYNTPERIKNNEWYRIGITVKHNVEYDYYIDNYDIYIDGFRDFKMMPGFSDGQFTLDTNGVLLFANNSDRDFEMDIADIKLYTKALTEQEMKTLGGYHKNLDITFAQPDIAIYPYLQAATESSIYICWHASTSKESIVEYGTSELLGKSKSGDVHIWRDSTAWHWVKLKNLQPNTIYYYQAISGKLKSDMYKFKTPHKVGEKKGHIRFAIVGDTRTFPKQTKNVISSIREKITELYGDSDIENNLNLILCNGDIVSYGLDLSEYKAEWFEPLKGISANIPIMVTIGDHEKESDIYYNYMKYEDFAGTLGEKHYSFQYGRVLFIADHSIINTKAQYNLRDKKLKWLNSVMQKAEKDSTIDWVIVFTHRPGHSEIWTYGNESYVQDYVIPLLSKYSKAELLTYGHSHAYERGQVIDGNLRLLENGGGGSELDRWRESNAQKDYPEIQKTYDYWSYTIVDIDIENKSYQAKSFSLGNSDVVMQNKLFDSFIRNKTNEAPPQKPIAKTNGEVKIPILLKASEYKGNYKILSSQFQVTNKQGNYSKLIVDIKRDFENIYSDSGSPGFIPINKNKGIDLTKYLVENNKLEPDKVYYWRVRYRDKNLQWSEWSDEISFFVNKI